jgi:hypothetical protein
VARQFHGSKTCQGSVFRGPQFHRVNSAFRHVNQRDHIDLTDGANSLNVKILSVVTEPYKELSDQHAHWEGFQTVSELQKDLEKYYQKIDPEQPITTIRFELA